jgi:phosphoribosylaminoimidazole carboxylase PurE protein
MMSNYFVAVMMGSDSDLPTMQSCVEALKGFNIPFELRIMSAHRTPNLTAEYVHDATQRGCQIFIAAAGLAAHLAGAVAANTVRPVIGVPLDAGSLNGMDALLATVQMPGGTPVACTSIGKAGAKNAAFLAAQILALQYPELNDKLVATRKEKRISLQQANEKLQQL